MKIKIISTAVLIAIALTSCGDKKSQPQTTTQNENVQSNSVKPLLAQAEITDATYPKAFYVTANSGLSLRASSNLKSKKVLTLPYGAQVQFIDSPAHTAMTVSDVHGKMLEIEYQGARGFAFDGYLSTLAPPQTDEAIEDYAKRISTAQNAVTVSKVPSKKGENYGMTTTINLPAKSWNEAYKVAQKLFNLPRSIKPELSGKKTATILVNEHKRERTFTDELTINTTDNGSIDYLIYSYKLRDYNRQVTISKTLKGFKVIEEEESL